MFNGKHDQKEIQVQIDLAMQLINQGPERFLNWLSEQQKNSFAFKNPFDEYMRDNGVPGFCTHYIDYSLTSTYDNRDYRKVDYFYIILPNNKQSKLIEINSNWVRTILSDYREQEEARNRASQLAEKDKNQKLRNRFREELL